MIVMPPRGDSTPFGMDITPASNGSMNITSESNGEMNITPQGNGTENETESLAPTVLIDDDGDAEHEFERNLVNNDVASM